MPRSEGMRVIGQLPVHGAGPAEPSTALVVGGAVARPLLLNLDELAALPAAEVTEDFVSREGWCVPGLHWRGVALATVLEIAAPELRAGWVEVASGDFATVLTRTQAESALLAMSLGDGPVPREHGGPLRLIVPGADCYTSIKWVDRVDVHAEAPADRANAIALARIGQPID